MSLAKQFYLMSVAGALAVHGRHCRFAAAKRAWLLDLAGALDGSWSHSLFLAALEQCWLSEKPASAQREAVKSMSDS